MEESSNGKVEEIPREESGGKKEKEVVNDDESGGVKVMVVDGKSESVDENHDGSDSSSGSSSDGEAELKEKSPQVVDSGEFEEEKAVEVSDVDLVNQDVPQSEEFNDGEEEASAVQTKDVTELKTEGPEEVSNETSGVSEEVSNEKSKINEEAALLPSDGNDAMTEVVSKVIEEVKLPSSEDNGEAPGSVGITEEESKQNSGESAYAVDVESKEKVEELASSSNVEETTDASEIANRPEISENNGNQPIISLNQRTVQPTSWRSCCGIFEVLRRSDR